MNLHRRCQIAYGHVIYAVKTLPEGNAVNVTKNMMTDAMYGLRNPTMLETLNQDDLSAFVRKLSDDQGVQITAMNFATHYQIYRPIPKEYLIRKNLKLRKEDQHNEI